MIAAPLSILRAILCAFSIIFVLAINAILESALVDLQKASDKTQDDIYSTQTPQAGGESQTRQSELSATSSISNSVSQPAQRSWPIQIVNKCQSNVFLSLLFHDGANWVTKGWWEVPRKESIKTDALSSTDVIYLYGLTFDRQFFWSGEGSPEAVARSISMDTSYSFIDPSQLAAEGATWVKFEKITARPTTDSYQVELTCPQPKAINKSRRSMASEETAKRKASAQSTRKAHEERAAIANEGSGGLPCTIKPVMTDQEIDACRK